MDIDNYISTITDKYKDLSAEKRLTEDNIKIIEKAINDKKVNVDKLNKSLVLINEVGKKAREIAKTQLETIVTDSLKYIHGENCRFEIELKEQRGVPSAEFYVITEVNGEESRQIPEEACGGGYIDAISTALRYAYIKAFNNPNPNNAIILDEPGKMLSEQASVKFAEFVKQLGVLFNKQTIMVTHNDMLKSVADKSFDVVKNGDESKVTEHNVFTLEDEDLNKLQKHLNNIVKDAMRKGIKK